MPRRPKPVDQSSLSELTGDDAPIELPDPLKVATKALTEKTQEAIDLQTVIDRQVAQIGRLARQLIPLERLQKKEAIGTFKNIADDEVSGFETFERVVAHYPREIEGGLRWAYKKSWERAYWFGFLLGREKRLR